MTTLFIGTYTAKAGVVGSHGIYTCGWNAATGELTAPTLTAATPNPTFLALSPVRGTRVLYAVNEISDFGETHNGSVTSFRIEGSAVRLHGLSAVDSGGDGPCHIALDHSGRSVFVANYGGGSVASFRVLKNGAQDGGLSPAVSHFQFSGHGADPKRQEAPHTHGVTVSPGNRFVLVNDLGLDRIMVFRMNPATATLTPNEGSARQPYWSARPGSGPRHSLFHPSGRWLYSVNELHSTVDQLAWNEEHGTLKLLSTAVLLPSDFAANTNRAAELAIDAGGRFLYASNRGHDSIAVLSIDRSTGTLTTVQRVACGGKNPRHFAVDPSGNWLLVANQDTNNLVVFRRDPISGKLMPGSGACQLDKPVCLVFA